MKRCSLLILLAPILAGCQGYEGPTTALGQVMDYHTGQAG